MSKKLLQYIVIILGGLIFFSFVALIYGMYLKISTTPKKFSAPANFFSANLKKDEKIKDIKVIDKHRLLVLIEDSDDIKGAIYDIELNNFIQIIEK